MNHLDLGNHHTMLCQTIMLYTLNIYNYIYQLFLNGVKKKKETRDITPLTIHKSERKQAGALKSQMDGERMRDLPCFRSQVHHTALSEPHNKYFQSQGAVVIINHLLIDRKYKSLSF